MATGHLLNNEGEALRIEIRNILPYGQELVSDTSPTAGRCYSEERIMAGDLEAVNNLFHSILYVGVV